MDKTQAFDFAQGYTGREHDTMHNALEKDIHEQRHEVSAFHYTSFKNCLNMLDLKTPESKHDGKYLGLWVSHFSFLNDPNELRSSLQSIIENLENRRHKIKNKAVEGVVSEFIDKFKTVTPEHLPPNYILSFSTEGNILTQWKHYGKDCGVSIEYDLPNLVFSGLRSDDDYDPLYAYRVIYAAPEETPSLTNVLANIENLSGTDAGRDAKSCILNAFAIANFVKNEHYRDEREVRMLFSPYYREEAKDIPQKQSELMEKVCFRPREHDIVRYLKIRLRHKNPEKFPIKSITVGPGANQKQIYRALIMFVQSHYQSDTVSFIPEQVFPDHCTGVIVNGIAVKYSLIPFRG